MAYSPEFRRILHRMDYYSYQEGLISRYLNQKEAWDSHLARCREYILRSVALFRPATVTVLGSGWLLEVPLIELAEEAGRINLVDIIHPADVVRQVAGLGNVNLVEADVSGGLVGQLASLPGRNLIFKGRLDLGSIHIPEYEYNEDPGMVISVNLLSQIDSLPVRMLRNRFRLNENDILSFRERIQMSHIAMLRRHRSVLISDHTEVFTSVNGNKTEEKTVVAQIPDGQNPEEWTWDFDVAGADFNRKRSVLKVKAVMY